ncbi:unnamed protein product [Penicillium roqueforti FM164]|uniref:Genomic scaffold, ProqFM164S03 n=1 Tax=Penicillium roqueforti (strain FM164) TaxID=1365484 RepID=W6QIM2_PENRF|nr:unnamed protein product [Penicillium roqueforti FM164]
MFHKLSVSLSFVTPATKWMLPDFERSVEYGRDGGLWHGQHSERTCSDCD